MTTPKQPRPGESKEEHRARVAAAQAAMKARMEEAKRRGYTERGPFTTDVKPGRGTPSKPKPLPTPPKPTPVPVTPPYPKDRPRPKPAPGKPVLMRAKSGGMVKGKK